MNPTKNDILILLSAGEGQRLEFKRDASSSVARSLVAFANAEGGRVVFGVNDKNQITGVSDTNKAMAVIQSTARNCDPPVSVGIHHLKMESKSLLIADVSSGDKKPYARHDGYFLRTGATSQKMNRDELVTFVRKNNPLPFDEMICPAFTLGELDEKAYKDFLMNAKINAASMTPLDVLQNLNLVSASTDPTFKNAAVLFFAKEPVKFIRQSVVTCLLFAGNDKAKILDRKELDGNLAETVKQAMAFLQRHLSLRYEIKSLVRKEILELPEDALREALLNAVIHRDYSIAGSNVMVEIFRDRVEIVSPGGLPQGMLETELGRKSVRRNPLIADVFHRLGEVEKAGSGISRILLAAEKARVPKPVFQSNGFFTVVFPKLKKSKGTKKAPRRHQEENKQGLSRDQDGTKTGLSRDQVKVLRSCLKPNSLVAMMKVVGRSNRTKFRKALVVPLLELELLRMTEPEAATSGNQRYVLTPKGVKILKNKTKLGRK